MATNQPVVVFDVPGGRLDCLSAFELGSKQLVHRFDAPPVHPVNAGVIRIHTPIAQIDERLLHGSARAPSQRIALSNLCCQGVPINRLRAKRLAPRDQTLLVGDGQTKLDAELVAGSNFTLADALDLGCVQCVELVLVFPLLRANAIRTLQ